MSHARRFGDIASRRANPYAYWPNSPLPERCLRVGLVSGDMVLLCLCETGLTVGAAYRAAEALAKAVKKDKARLVTPTPPIW